MKTILAISFAGLIWGCGVRGRPRPPQFEHATPVAPTTSNSPSSPTVDDPPVAKTGEECPSCTGASNE